MRLDELNYLITLNVQFVLALSADMADMNPIFSGKIFTTKSSLKADKVPPLKKIKTIELFNALKM